MSLKTPFHALLIIVWFLYLDSNNNIIGIPIVSGSDNVVEVEGYEYIGCFRDNKDTRALPFKLDGKFSMKECCEACTKKGFFFSGRQYLSECYCGYNHNAGSNTISYDHYGPRTDCGACDAKNVGPYRNCVYQLKQQPQQANPTNVILDAVIIGAGWAGIAAGKELSADGNNNFVILEAKDWIGGRTHTVTLNDDSSTPIELGSQWINGIGNNGNSINPIYQALLDYCNHVGKTGGDKDCYRIDNYVSKTYYNGKRLNIEIDRMTKEVIWPDYLDYQTQRQCDTTRDETNIRTIANHYVESTSLNGINKAVFEKLLDSRIATEYAANLDDLGSWFFDSGKAFPGSSVYVPNYSKVIQHYASSIQEKILLESIVKKIDYSSNIVQVTYNDNQVVRARHVLITVPLGVLKSNDIEFVPPLPQPKQTAIQSLGMGILDKVVLIWEKGTDVPWNTGWVTKVSEQDQGKFTEFYNPKFYDFDDGQPPRLVAFLAGRNAVKYAEQISNDEIVKNTMMESLRGMFASRSIPEPKEWIVQRWNEDPFARGSYSYYPKGSKPQHRSILQRTIAQKLFFAGEATSKDYFGTTHGAFFSGQEAAKKIIFETTKSASSSSSSYTLKYGNEDDRESKFTPNVPDQLVIQEQSSTSRLTQISYVMIAIPCFFMTLL